MSSSSEDIQFGIAFQNFGDVELFLAEAEFYEFSHDDDATACRQGREARPSQIVPPMDGNWFVIPSKKTAHKRFSVPLPDVVAGRKHFCIRLEAYDVYGQIYTSYDRIVSGVLRLSATGRISMSATNYHEKPISLASQRYILKP
ncbi:hypothetical protein JANAI62_21110 [Jannaschia pagri]|uniref:Uncharacterized protein n=1 Tax=Jannaschia pagri TaxID=2829797 RepID=A0ABQ4NM47_9RHOB|nr:hypothetical protein JANAI61_21120 [Jannaschia sp. AI_61]GIT95488.1 hypothetical protein JANAI62_21110 [Jannaschia sp. AI_62]